MKKIFLTLLIITGFCFIGCKKSEAVKFLNPEKGVYIVDIDTAKKDLIIEPYVSEGLETLETMAKKTNAKVAINAGFFDPINQKTISYVTQNGKITLNPQDNENLTQNAKLTKYLPQIFNRSEFRILKNNKFDITKHDEISENEIIHAIQAGPELYPKFDLQEEAFIDRKDGKLVRHSISALCKVPRSAVAIKGKHLLIIAISEENPMTLEELSNYTQKLGVDKALAFDGGSSTSLYVKEKNFILNSAKDNSARRIKSALIIK